MRTHNSFTHKGFFPKGFCQLLTSYRWGKALTSKVAVIQFDGDPAGSLEQVLDQIDGIDELRSVERSVVLEVGVFSHKAGARATIPITTVEDAHR